MPTLKELGYDVEYYLWVGIFAPKGTPPAIVNTLRAAIGKAVQSDQFKATLANVGQERRREVARGAGEGLFECRDADELDGSEPGGLVEPEHQT